MAAQTQRTLDNVIKAQATTVSDLARAVADIKALKAADARFRAEIASLEASIAEAAAAASGLFVQTGTGAVTRAAQDKLREASVSITDFLVLDTPTGRATALKNAMVVLNGLPGGTLKFPKRADDWHFDFTGAGGIEWTNDWIFWDLDGSVLYNDSTDGTEFVLFDGAAKSIQHGGISNGKFESDADAGEIFLCGAFGVSFFAFVDLWCHQKNPDVAICKFDHVGNRGWFETRFEGGIYEHGTTFNPATVPAFYFRADKNTFSTIAWQGPMRIQCHHSESPFFYVEKTGNPSGSQFHAVTLTDINVEQAKRGFFVGLGCEGVYGRKVEFFDSDEIDGHLWYVGTSADTDDVPGAGRNSEFFVLEQCQFQSGEPADVAEATVVGVSGGQVSVDTLTQSGGLATVVCDDEHELGEGQRGYIEGAVQTEYNGRFTVVDVIDEFEFTYQLAEGDEGATSPATGTITAGPAAMDVMIGDGVNFVTITNAKSPASRIAEIDFNNRSCYVAGHNSRVLLFRVNEKTSVIIAQGVGEAAVYTPVLRSDRIEPWAESFVEWSPLGQLQGIKATYVTATTMRLELGRCRSDDDTFTIDSPGNLTINLATSGALGIDTGSVAVDKWYKVYLLGDSTGDLSASAVLVKDSDTIALPAGYDKKRLVWRIRTFDVGAGVANIRKFFQKGAGSTRSNYWDLTETITRELDAGSATTLTDVIMNGSMPPESQFAHLTVGFTPNAAGNNLVITPSNFTTADWIVASGIVAGVLQRSTLSTPTSSGQRVQYKVTAGTDDAWIYVRGWDMDL